MSDVLRAGLDPLILALLKQQPDHGYSLMLRIRAQTGRDLSDGSLYPALRRLEESGRITGSWETVDRRRRKVFSLTDQGNQSLRRARADWNVFAKALNAVLGGAADPKEAPQSR